MDLTCYSATTVIKIDFFFLDRIFTKVINFSVVFL